MLDILVAEDDRDLRDAVSEALVDAGHRVACAKDGAEALALIERRAFDVALCDVNMPVLSGIALARRLRVRAPATAVVVMTAQGTVADVVEVMRRGAVEFLTKPFDLADLEERVLRPIDERLALRRRLDEALAVRTERRIGTRVVAECPDMRALIERLDVAAHDDAPVILSGEAGTGKKTLARYLHERGPRRDGPFVVVPCATLPTMMREAEVRALESGRGAAAGDAWFRRAEGGTLVLDGVDQLSVGAQTSLMRVLDEPETSARRDPQKQPRGVRVVATASEGATSRVRTGAWFEPLFFRLAGLVMRVPPLRDRAGDLLSLSAELLVRLSRAHPPTILPSAWTRLEAYAFPGNVAELAWAITWALHMADDAPIEATHLPPRLLRDE